MIFHLLPAASQSGQSSPQVRPVVIVVSPLNALTKDQIRRVSQGTLNAAALNVKRKRNSADRDFELNMATQISHI